MTITQFQHVTSEDLEWEEWSCKVCDYVESLFYDDEIVKKRQFFVQHHTKRVCLRQIDDTMVETFKEVMGWIEKLPLLGEGIDIALQHGNEDQVQEALDLGHRFGLDFIELARLWADQMHQRRNLMVEIREQTEDEDGLD